MARADGAQGEVLGLLCHHGARDAVLRFDRSALSAWAELVERLLGEAMALEPITRTSVQLGDDVRAERIEQPGEHALALTGHAVVGTKLGHELLAHAAADVLERDVVDVFFVKNLVAGNDPGGKHHRVTGAGPGRADGPLPEHYEPMECPVEKNLMSGTYTNPTAPVYGTEADVYKTCDPRFPFVGTTYRVVEHWQTGVMTRYQPWLLEMQPQVFVEMSEELAKLKGFDVELQTTPWPSQFDAPGGLRKGLGGYHAWQSRDMKNWVHHGPVTEAFSKWVTTAEYVDGKVYIYYLFGDYHPVRGDIRVGWFTSSSVRVDAFILRQLVLTLCAMGQFE